MSSETLVFFLYFFCLVMGFSVAGIGVAFTRNDITTKRKPVFGITYILIGASVVIYSFLSLLSL